MKEYGYYLAFPNGTVEFDPDDHPDDMSRAREVMQILLEGEPWVQYHAHHAPGQYTQWTVMKRDERGVPLQLMCQEFNGNMELINTVRDEEG